MIPKAVLTVPHPPQMRRPPQKAVKATLQARMTVITCLNQRPQMILIILLPEATPLQMRRPPQKTAKVTPQARMTVITCRNQRPQMILKIPWQVKPTSFLFRGSAGFDEPAA